MTEILPLDAKRTGPPADVRFAALEHLEVTAADRILIFAPHPDDEALATGGLLQRAVNEGASMRVVFATDGENNPWPQRAIERRWRISADRRARWGALRRKEALRSLARLGVDASAAVFLGLPDGGLTELLASGNRQVLAALKKSIDEYQPTLLVSPSLRDVHADHSALAVLLRLALDEVEEAPERVLEYLVHTHEEPTQHAAFSLSLSASEKRAKHDAIACHETQMLFSHRRFLAYARDAEFFEDGFFPLATEDVHPVCHVSIQNDALTIRLRARGTRSPFSEPRIHLILEEQGHGCLHYDFAFPRRSVAVDGGIQIEIKNGFADIVVPIETRSVQRVFVKFAQTKWFRDLAGWREFVVSSESTALRPFPMSTAGAAHPAYSFSPDWTAR